nr:hypothetical protein [Dyella acidiphila]
MHGQLHVRVAALERRQHRLERNRQRRHGANAYRDVTGGDSLHFLDIPARTIHALKHMTRMFNQTQAVGRQPCALARTNQQRHSQLLLQRLQSPAQRRLGDVETLGRLLQAARFMHRDEAAQVVQFHGAASTDEDTGHHAHDAGTIKWLPQRRATNLHIDTNIDEEKVARRSREATDQSFRIQNRHESGSNTNSDTVENKAGTAP